MGAPVFAGANSGWLYAFGPTAGYLAGFAMATFFIPFSLGSRNASLGRIVGILALADILILLCGSLWLKLLLHLSSAQALALGFIPFIPGDMLKVLAAAVVYRGIKRRVAEIIA
jgi:biotin transport system substrate-specific component